MGFELDLHTEALGQLYTTEPVCVEPHTTVRETFQRMNDQRRGAVLICRQGVLVGIFTERDALLLIVDTADLDIPIEHVMTKNPIVLSQADTVAAAIGKMARGGYRRLPIIDDEGRPTGFLKANSILHFLVDHFPATVFNLPPTPHHTTETREGA